MQENVLSVKKDIMLHKEFANWQIHSANHSIQIMDAKDVRKDTIFKTVFASQMIHIA